MKRFLIAIVLLLLFAIALPCGAASNELDGEWIGEFKLNETDVFMRVRFETQEETVKAVFDMPLQKPRRVESVRLSFERPRLHFELPTDSGSIVFDGQAGNSSITGTVSRASARGTFELIRLAAVDLELYQKYAGSYQFGAKFIDIGPFSENENRLRFFDSSSRRTGVLYGISETDFISGPSVGVAFPAEIKVTFLKDNQGNVSGINWRENTKRSANLDLTLTGKKVDAYTQEEVSFTNGDVHLRGTLTIPNTKGLHPAIVLIPGSGPARRPGGFWIPFFARYGIAILVFDKRGAGQSTGDWSKSTYQDLAGDALAAVHVLKNHKGIDPKQIGLWGNSEGGWVAPLAASQSSDISFLIIRSGSALPVWKTVLHEAEGQLRDGNGLSEDEIRAALSLKASVERIALDESNWDEAWSKIDAAYQRVRNARWFNYVAVTPKDNWIWQWWRLRGGYDPAPALSKIRCPVLVLLGEVDWAIPSKESAAAFEQAFKQSGHTDYSVRILPKANHGLLRGETGFGSESPRLKSYVAGYMDGMISWLMERLKLSNRTNKKSH